MSNDLSTIMTTEAKVALPEMVSIFLSKYETDLYEKKTELSKIISGIKEEITANTKAAEQSVSFKEYDGLTIKILGLMSEVSKSRSVEWEKEIVSADVHLLTDRDTHRVNISKRVSRPLKKAFVKKNASLQKDLNSRSEELSLTVQAITDMSRKERQIKGRISELHLKEQGLEKFINSPEMMQLIKID